MNLINAPYHKSVVAVGSGCKVTNWNIYVLSAFLVFMTTYVNVNLGAPKTFILCDL